MMKRNLKINGRSIGINQPPYIIAELSANHNGSIERALKAIETAKGCGADAVKIQTYTADTMTIDSDRPDFLIKGGPWDGFKLYDLYKWAETPFEWHEAMFSHARKVGITLFSTPFDETAVDLLERLNAPAYKIASFEAIDLPLIRYVANTKKPMIISTGMASELEIEEAVDTARDAGCNDLVLLHCVSSYPAPIEQANLLRIPKISERFNVLSGLSDHTLGTLASIAAVSLGACLLEKHFTLSRAEKGPDSEFSLEPQELSSLCKDAKQAWLSLGSPSSARPKAESKSIIFRRSIYFVKDMNEGQVISNTDIRRIRPGLGLAPKHFDQIVGMRLSRSVERGTPVSWDLLKT
jgi:pseudaminic acid synthase